MQRKLILFISFFTFVFCLVPFMHASAAPTLEVKAEAGFLNKAKVGKGLPLHITVTNSGSPFSGDLVINSPESYMMGSGVAIPIEIGENETKTFDVFLEGYSGDYYSGNGSYSMFHFFEGGWENGKSIPYEGDKTIRPQLYSPDTTLVLTLSTNSDRLKGLSKVTPTGAYPQPIEILHLGQIKDLVLPTNEAGWSMADYLFIDEYILADLSQEEQQAILNWIKKGGHAVIGASDNVAAEVGILKDYLPLSLQAERFEVSKETLTTISDGGIFTQSIPAYKSALAEGSSPLLKSGEDILAAQKSVGKGSIIQTSFSLGDKPLIDLDGYPKLIEKLIENDITNNMSTMPVYGTGMKENVAGQLGYTNELFPSFQVNTLLIIGIVIIYIIIVGPLLFFVLRRKDKREHAWWIIPLISIVTSVGIFAYGAKDRLIRPQIQQTSVLKANNDGSLSGYYVESLLSNRSGDFEFMAPLGTTMTFSQMNGMMTESIGNLHKNAIVENDANGSKLTIRNSKYWSVSSVIGETFIQNSGNLDINLAVSDAKVNGTIKNNFPFALKNVSIWSGARLIDLGDIAAGEEMKVDSDIKSPMLFPASMIYQNNQPPTNVEEIMQRRKEDAIGLASVFVEEEKLPSIVAWTDEAIIPIELTSSKADMSSVNVIVQSFNPKTSIDGEFVLPANAMENHISAENDGFYPEKTSNNGNEWMLENGDYSHTWTIPEAVLEKNISWKELQLANTNPETLNVEIYNVATDSYEEVTSGRLTITQNVEQYISEEGEVKFLLHKNATDGNVNMLVPELRLKGEVQE